MLLSLSPLALAGPPYATDDPEPTDYKHFEIYLFSGATSTRDGTVGAAGIDFNYGAGPDLQLTAVVPLDSFSCLLALKVSEGAVHRCCCLSGWRKIWALGLRSAAVVVN